MRLFRRPSRPVAGVAARSGPAAELPLFDADGRVTAGCEWVGRGEGTSTLILWGPPALLDDCGRWLLRTDNGWCPAGETDYVGEHARALVEAPFEGWRPGRYYLCAPGLGGNAHEVVRPVLVPEGWAPVHDAGDVVAAPRSYPHLVRWLSERSRYRGVVWRHPDGRRATFDRWDLPGARGRQRPGAALPECDVAVGPDGRELPCPLCRPGP